MSLVEERCEALIPVGPGEHGNTCPRMCGEPAVEEVGGRWFCVTHIAMMETEGGVWVQGDCPHCNGVHGHEPRQEAPNPFRILP